MTFQKIDDMRIQFCMCLFVLIERDKLTKLLEYSYYCADNKYSDNIHLPEGWADRSIGVLFCVSSGVKACSSNARHADNKFDIAKFYKRCCRWETGCLYLSPAASLLRGAF